MRQNPTVKIIVPFAPSYSLSANAVGGEGRGEVARFSFSRSILSFASFVLFCGHLFFT
jgi:hypothetical protein